MSTTVLIPVEEYLRLTEKPYREYRDGVVSPKAMPTKFHAIIQYALLMLLRGQGVRPRPSLPCEFRRRSIWCLTCLWLLIFPDHTPLSRFSFVAKFCLQRIAWEYHAESEPARVSTMLRAGDLKVNVEELFSALDEQ